MGWSKLGYSIGFFKSLLSVNQIGDHIALSRPISSDFVFCLIYLPIN